jgi:hypothetical protein
MERTADAGGFKDDDFVGGHLAVLPVCSSIHAIAASSCSITRSTGAMY